MKALSTNPCGVGIYRPPQPPSREGRNLFIKANVPQTIPPSINPERVTREIPNRPVITQHREDLSTHPLARNFDVKEHTIDPIDFRCSNKPNIEVFRRILDAADLFGCHILEICALKTRDQPALEMVKCIIQKLKANPQFEVRFDKTDFKYFRKVFLKKEGYHPKQLLVSIFPMGTWDDYICKFNHAFNTTTTSTTQSARVTLQRPTVPPRQQSVMPQLSPPRSIPRTTPELERAAQKPPSPPMREPARVIPQVNRTPNSSNVPQVTQNSSIIVNEAMRDNRGNKVNGSLPAYLNTIEPDRINRRITATFKILGDLELKKEIVNELTATKKLIWVVYDNGLIESLGIHKLVLSLLDEKQVLDINLIYKGAEKEYKFISQHFKCIKISDEKYASLSSKLENAL